MKENLLKEFKSEYQRRLKEKEEVDKRVATLMNRKAIMENSPIIRDYIELCAQIEAEKENFSYENEVFYGTLCDFKDKGLLNETNGIFLYAGTFYTEYGYTKRTSRDSADAEFDSYIDIESFKGIDVPVEDREEFENNNDVLFLPEENSHKYMLHEIREEFVNDALSDGQEVARKKILSRYKKN